MLNRLASCIAAVIGIIALVLMGCGASGPEPELERVTLNLLIRVEDERSEMGDYIGNILEDLGFAVERSYKTGGEAAPIWLLGNPELGLWNLYTASWVGMGISRDQGGQFGFFYTELGNEHQSPLWEAYEPTEEFLGVATRLCYNDFTTVEERRTLFGDALWMSMEDSARVFLVNRCGFEPLGANVSLAANLASGILGSRLWAHTVHFQNEAGVPLLPTNSTTLRMATADVLSDPWNPVSGSGWQFNRFPQSATGDLGVGIDTNDGLCWPFRIEKAELSVLESLPVTVNPGHESWLTLSFVEDEIGLPSTVWADWDAETQEFITAGPGTTAKAKIVVYYPEDIFTVPLHDGSTLSPADFLLYAIMQFDRAKEDSLIYDPGYTGEFETFMSHFKGVDFDFDVPGYGLVVTTYDDRFHLDAERMITFNEAKPYLWPMPVDYTWFPAGDQGPWVWHNIALGILAERDSELAFSDIKSHTLGIEWMSFVDGPSLEILEAYLADVQNSGSDNYAFIAYENVLGEHVDQGEALARYANLQNWYDAHDHFWVASGPFYLDSVDPIADIVHLRRFLSYPDAGDRWFFLLDPQPVNPPMHTGAWVDDVVIDCEGSPEAVTKLQDAELDVYAFPIADKELFQTIQADPDLTYCLSCGQLTDFTLNPVGPLFAGTGKLNPFAVPEIREALNWAIDREYICSAVMGGLGIPSYTCIAPVFADAIRYADILAQIEAYYAHDLDKADETIEEAMLAIPGVTRDAEGKYWYEVSS